MKNILPLFGFAATLSPPGGWVPAALPTSFDLRFIGLREGAFGSDGNEVLEGGGPGALSSKMWANILSNLSKKREQLAQSAIDFVDVTSKN